MKAETQFPKEASDDIDLLEIAQNLISQWLLIAVFVVLGGVAGAVSYLSQPKIFRADAIVQIENSGSSVVALEGITDLVGDQSSAVAEIEILRSRQLLERVVAELNLTLVSEPRRLPILQAMPQRFAFTAPQLDSLAPFDWDDTAIDVGMLRFPNSRGSNFLTVRQQEGAAFEIITPSGESYIAEVGVPFVAPDGSFELTMTGLEGPVGREFSIGHRSEEDVVRSLRGGLNISEVGRGSNVLSVSLSDRNRFRAEEILHAVTQAYLDQNINRNAAEVQQGLEFIENQLPTARARFDAAQEALNEYREEQRSVDLGTETQILLQQATAIRGQLNQLDLDEQDIAQRFNQSHPTYRRLLASRAELERQLEEVEDETQRLPETQKQIFNLQQSVDVSQEIFFQLENRARELRIARASTIGNVRIIDRARSSSIPISPRRNAILLVHLAGGLLLGSVIALLSQMRRRTIESLSEIEALGFPLFGVIERAQNAMVGRPNRRSNPKLLREIPNTEQSQEALRSLRTAIFFGFADDNKTVSITSAAPEEGKSFVSANLADVCGQTGQNVVLVDTDMRRGYLAKYYGISRTMPGLAEYLSGAVELDEVLYKPAGTNFTLIPTGKYPPNASELLLKPQFGDLVEKLREQFELTVFDTAPLLAVTDPVIVMRHVGLALAVVRHQKTEIQSAKAMGTIVERANLRLSGLIVNSFNRKSGGGQKYYAYSGQYRYENR
ncbi:MAG: polysaccharide biosynthesis tyrosine autokinase [Pseudomonadota bacterium]